MKQENEEMTPEQKLKQEATLYYNLAKEYRRDRYMKEEPEKWKEYVNYAFVKRNIQYSYYYSQNLNKTYEPKMDSHPGPIDNSPLLVDMKDFLNDGDPNNLENIVIRHNVDQRSEVKIVNRLIWEFFFNLYGGGPEINKPLIEEKKYSNSSKKIIEIFSRKINLVAMPKRKDFNPDNLAKLEVHTIYISRTKSLEDVKNKFSKLIAGHSFYKDEGVEAKNIRTWKLVGSVSLEQLKKVLSDKSDEIRQSEDPKSCSDLIFLEHTPNAKLEEVEIADTDLCMLEYSTETSPWIFLVEKVETKQGSCEWCRSHRLLRYCCPCKEVWYCTENCFERDKTYHNGNCKKRFEIEENSIKPSARSKNGLIGLQNLGNTCFMNTSLQCISNCYELTEYFLKDLFKKDINVDNPIGTSGVLARAYANLLKNLWHGESTSFSPWNFKKAIGTFQSMFTGYQQHDTQEFLNYLLDGLHEDLNRVLKKPMVEKEDSTKPDEIKSKEQWMGFLRRNQSTLVDLFYGQFKSTLYCPDSDCQNVSTTFDPFLSMSLPLAAKTDTYEVMCYYIFYNVEQKPLQLKLPFNVETTIMAFRNKIAKLLNIHPFSFLVVKMDEKANYDHFVSSTALLKTNNYFFSDSQKPFFLFQIDPDMFYSELNKFAINDIHILQHKRDYSNITEELESRSNENKKLFTEDYEEDESGYTSDKIIYYSKFTVNSMMGKNNIKIKINVDDNNGFSNDFLKVIITLFTNDDTYSHSKKKRIIFPRVVYLNKSWTTKQVHLYIFKYFAPLLRTKYNLSKEEHTDENLWLKFFDGLDSDNTNDTYEFQKKHMWPYRLRIRNIIQNNRYDKCYFCNETECEYCLLPFNDKITIQDLIDKIPKVEDMEVDNNYYFLSDKQKHYNSHNRDFQLEAFWLKEYFDTVHTFNDKRDYDFEIMKTAKNKTVSIYDCFRNFVKLEKLEENNEWYCPQCKKHQKATKKMEIYKSPNILIIHLKRFKNTSKIDCVVDFPIEGLDISQYVIEKEGMSAVYDLFAIANHFGSMGFGHYTAYAKNPMTQKWYDFDDSHVSNKSPDDLVGSSAYVLFYRRRGLEQQVDMNEIYNKQFIDYEKELANSTSHVEDEDEDVMIDAAGNAN